MVYQSSYLGQQNPPSIGSYPFKKVEGVSYGAAPIVATFELAKHLIFD